MITILLATYNGEQYLAEQLESILAQSEHEWKLIIQDDCSTDETVAVARRYAELHFDRIQVIQRDRPSGSAKNNFFSMLRYVDTEYWMTCDQDDIWLPNKIKVTLDAMHRLEADCYDVPLLVHSDLAVIDQNRKMIAKSLFIYQKLDSKRDSFANLLSQNIVSGCTALMNRALIDKLHQIPSSAIMHDWWFALVAAAFGRIAFVGKPTLLYRQHSKNSVGAKSAGNILYLFERAIHSRQTKNMLNDAYLQAQSFLNCYEADMSEKLRVICHSFVLLPSLNKLQKIQYLNKYDFWKSGIVRRLGLFVYV